MDEVSKRRPAVEEEATKFGNWAARPLNKALVSVAEKKIKQPTCYLEILGVGVGL